MHRAVTVAWAIALGVLTLIGGYIVLSFIVGALG